MRIVAFELACLGCVGRLARAQILHEHHHSSPFQERALALLLLAQESSASFSPCHLRTRLPGDAPSVGSAGRGCRLGPRLPSTSMRDEATNSQEQFAAPAYRDGMFADSNPQVQRSELQHHVPFAEALMDFSKMFAMACLAYVFMQNAPAPSTEAEPGRCQQMMTGSIEAGDWSGAKKWLSMCKIPAEEAEQMLSDRWVQRWGRWLPPDTNSLPLW
mmetsp:Transcript_45072/g.84262  ORF Transcript_45072/g.84262 Transcript_45072/m.84262 type:complete len:216 (-) Transcript_45072:148-795(-)